MLHDRVISETFWCFLRWIVFEVRVLVLVWRNLLQTKTFLFDFKQKRVSFWMTLLTVEALRKSLSSIGDDFYAHRPFTAQWRSHPKNLGGPKTLVGTKIFNFVRITLSRLENASQSTKW